ATFARCLFPIDGVQPSRVKTNQSVIPIEYKNDTIVSATPGIDLAHLCQSQTQLVLLSAK
ncbi:MAG TPA: hypothetical protein DCL61_04450, partial [Cyanobacteria bacterium UBA12227]|nr:hypothetical protein [Cyanobacteria bacterium UBA12227]HBY76996.1 hypothetical protein [Cyanobacteria bacterium UBA11148]